MSADYFTVAEYREVTKDRTVPYRAEDDDIIRVQREVIERLEQWARSAWPNVSQLATGAIATTTDALTSSASIFAATDVGSAIRVVGAGTAGADLETTIATYASATSVTLTDDAATTVTAGAIYLDGDGHAASPRSHDFSIFWRSPLINTRRTPVIDLTTFTVDDVDQDPDDYQIDLNAGTLRWGDWSMMKQPTLGRQPVPIEIAYTYGFTATPESVKRPCIMATETLLRTEEQRGGIPRNVDRYQTEGTNFDMTRTSRKTLPWPWDEDSSDDVRAYWERNRPRRMTSVDIM